MNVQLEEALEKIRAAMPPDNPKAQKAAAIAEFVIGHAQETVKNVSNIAAYSRKKPRILRKTKFRKKTLLKIVLDTRLRNYVAAHQLYALVAAPIPSYIKGGTFRNNGLAVVGEPCEEIILRPRHQPPVTSTLITPGALPNASASNV